MFLKTCFAFKISIRAKNLLYVEVYLLVTVLKCKNGTYHCISRFGVFLVTRELVFFPLLVYSFM